MRVNLCVIVTCLAALGTVARTAEAEWVASGGLAAPGGELKWLGPPPRHFIGLQLGGSVPVVIDYQYNVWGPIVLDAGAFGVPEGLAATTGGAIVTVYENQRWIVYVGAGASWAWIGGARWFGIHDTDVNHPLLFGYGRVGVGIKLGPGSAQQLRVDVGGWVGRDRLLNRQTDAVEGRERLLEPMLGLSWVVGIL